MKCPTCGKEYTDEDVLRDEGKLPPGVDVMGLGEAVAPLYPQEIVPDDVIAALSGTEETV